MFALRTVREARRLEITLTGFWDADTMLAFEGEMLRALRGLKVLGGAKSCLVDASSYPVQSSEISARHQRLLAGLGELAAERIAMIVPGQLVRRQAERTAADLHHRTFMAREEALLWLSEAD